ncbi:PREDICTED: protein jim lovell [Papilio xuthus]|uniref:Protein jim lovell n=1 Tax=Papilio xuthus TaxID=66420 RepID=A0AAJ6ZW27_PAPXU|nr:PREDICTED: protein jim lovell [Papilio xuthus]XP_013180268.1 PREDICTED: protein jim lovell [Papilio xuthus]XP_013180269.1 PREDICTED: protein jim lovell [Papilio xuthus]
MDDKPPATEEHYSLRWNNHQAHLLRSFEALLHAETLVDVTLVCSERRVRAHKVLLGACSPLFRRIFSENPCKHPVIVLKDFQGWEVQAVVDFMYRGEVSVAQEQLGTVIRAGESLQVRGLADQERERTRSPAGSPVRSPARATPAPSPPASPASPQPRRKQARPRRRSGESDTPENLSMRRSPSGLKAVRLARPRSPPSHKQEPEEPEPEAPPPPRMFPPHQDLFPPVPPAAVSALSLTPPHMFGIDSPLGLFPPGMEHKMYPLMDVEHRAPPLDAQLFTNVKKKWRPKGQHSAPRGGPPRSWTNAELTEALQHVWNKKMTTSQASRIFGIPYNSLLMYVRGKYGKSLKLEQLRKDCIGGPLDVLNLNTGNNNNNHPSKHHDKDDQHQNQGQRPSSSEPDITSNPMFNPFQQGFYPEFPPGFPMPLNMLHLLPPNDKARDLYQSMPMALDSLSGVTKEEDCKSDRSKENSADEEGDSYRAPGHPPHPPDTRTLLHHNGQD